MPYKGIAPAVTELIGGQIDLLFGNLLAVMPLVTGGQRGPSPCRPRTDRRIADGTDRGGAGLSPDIVGCANQSDTSVLHGEWLPTRNSAPWERATRGSGESLAAGEWARGRQRR